MKKFSIKELTFDEDDVLSRDELKNVLGGDDPSASSCSITCSIGSACCNSKPVKCSCSELSSPSCESGGYGSTQCSIST